MSIDEKAEDLINKIIEQNKLKKTQSNVSSKNYNNSSSPIEEITSEEEKKDNSRRDTVVENTRKTSDSNSSSDSPKNSNKNSDDPKNNNEEKIERKNSTGSNSSLENLMINQDLNFKTFTLASCLFLYSYNCIKYNIFTFIRKIINF